TANPSCIVSLQTRLGPRRSYPRGWRSTSDAAALPVDREADRGADRGDDPEAQDDLRLRPSLQLEVVMDRRHQEDAFSERLEGDHLDHDRQRLDHEAPAQQDQ